MYINKGLCFVYVDCPMKYIPTKRSSPPKGTSVAHRRSSMRGWTFNLSRPIPIGGIVNVKIDQNGLMTLMTMPQMDPNGSKWERGNGSSGISEWYFFTCKKRVFFILGECTWRTKSKTKLPPSRRARSNLVISVGYFWKTICSGAQNLIS